MTKELKHQYLVGYHGESQCVYGKDYENHPDYVDRLTLFQANRKLKQFNAKDQPKIYKLVPIEEAGVTDLLAACEALVRICNRIAIADSQEMRDEFASSVVQSEEAIRNAKKAGIEP